MEGYVVSLVEQCCQAELSAARPALKLLCKIANNIINAPSDPKFRRIKREAIAKKSQGVPLLDVLAAVGFTELETGFLCLPEGADLSLVQAALTAAQANPRWQTAQPSTTSTSSAPATQSQPGAPKSEAQLRLEAIQAENRKRVAAEKARKKKLRDEVNRKHKEQQANVRDRAVQSSVASKREFGAKMMKVEFKNKGG